ncbi:MAG: SDR family oxidoreductase, partial [Duodenibacillus sp.]|nr:SDR family oxidoreductase [Duodenibacillus sp.]
MMRLVLHGLPAEAVVLADLAEEGCPALEGRWTNLSDEKAIEKDFKDIQTKYGSIDVLINNAGISESTPFADYSADLFK